MARFAGSSYLSARRLQHRRSRLQDCARASPRCATMHDAGRQAAGIQQATGTSFVRCRGCRGGLSGGCPGQPSRPVRSAACAACHVALLTRVLQPGTSDDGFHDPARGRRTVRGTVLCTCFRLNAAPAGERDPAHALRAHIPTRHRKHEIPSSFTASRVCRGLHTSCGRPCGIARPTCKPDASRPMGNLHHLTIACPGAPDSTRSAGQPTSARAGTRDRGTTAQSRRGSRAGMRHARHGAT